MPSAFSTAARRAGVALGLCALVPSAVLAQGVFAAPDQRLCERHLRG
jgi:hypothetical protein